MSPNTLFYLRETEAGNALPPPVELPPRPRDKWLDRGCWLIAGVLLSSFFWLPRVWPR